MPKPSKGEENKRLSDNKNEAETESKTSKNGKITKLADNGTETKTESTIYKNGKTDNGKIEHKNDKKSEIPHVKQVIIH